MNTSELSTVWAPRLLSVLRIVAALIFLEHGTQKLLGFPPSPNPAPAMLSLSWFAGAIEIVGGTLLALGMSDGVGKQLLQRGPEVAQVAGRVRRLVRGVDRERHVRGGRRSAHGAHRLIGDMDERRRLGLERDAAGRELGVVEDAAELVVELARGAEHVVGMGGARRGVVPPVREQLGEADDAVQRRPGLVLE